MTQPTVSITIDAKYYDECVLRMQTRVNVAGLVEELLENYLDRTEGESPPWSEEYAADFMDDEHAAERAKKGSPDRGYLWQALLLPNGSEVRMVYQGREYHAEIRHQHLVYEGDSFTPSQWASLIANNTSRNAWRDLYIKLPGKSEYVLAEELRRRHR